MSDVDTDMKLQRLRALIADYSYYERRHVGMLAEIESLLAWAFRYAVHPGQTWRDVQALIGPPYGIIGEESQEYFRWRYPSTHSAAEAEQAAEWFHTLVFQRGKLQYIERSGGSD